jgi:hypothetical protein
MATTTTAINLFVCRLVPIAETRWHTFGSKTKSKEMTLDTSSLEP